VEVAQGWCRGGASRSLWNRFWRSQRCFHHECANCGARGCRRRKRFIGVSRHGKFTAPQRH